MLIKLFGASLLGVVGPYLIAQPAEAAHIKAIDDIYDDEDELAQVENYLMPEDFRYFNVDAGLEPIGLSDLAEIDAEEEGRGLSPPVELN